MKKKFALVIAIVMVLSIFTAVLVACNNLTITFDSNGGSKIDSFKETVDKEPIPDKEGYTFVGWYETKDYSSEKVVFPYTTTKNVTLYAKWEVKGPDVDDVITDLLKLISTQMNYDSSKKNIAWDFELDAFSTTGDTTTTYRLASKANIVTDNVNDAAISFALQEVAGAEVKNILSIVVDNEFIYLDTIDGDGNAFQRKFNGFALGEILKVKHIGDPNSIMDMALGMVFGLLFQEAKIDGDIVTLTGNVDEVLDALPGLLGAFIKDIDIAGIIDATGIVGMLTGTQFQLVANIKEFNGIKITAVKTDNFDAGISLNKATFDSKDTALTIDVPAAVKNLDAINLLNFTLEGRFSMVNKGAYYSEEKVSFDYTIRTDLDPFSMMEVQADGSVKFNAMNILDQGMIWIDIYHDCATHGGYANSYFCKTRQSAYLNGVNGRPSTGANGSILTVAFDPANFGNNNINLSINPLYILPNGLLQQLIGLDASGFLGDYVGLTINPEALVEMIKPSKDTPSTVADIDTASIIGTVFDILTNLDYSKNYLELISDIFNVLSGITVNNDGVNIDNIQSLFNIINNFVYVEGFDVGGIITKLFTQDTDEIELSVKNLAFADLNNVGFDAAARYLFVKPDKGGDIKKFTTLLYDLTPAFDYDWTTEKDIDGSNKVKLTADGVATHDDKGNALPLNAVEVEKLLSTGVAHYSATKLNGDTGNYNTNIIKVLSGLQRNADGTIKTGKHTVKLLTGMTDSGAITALLDGIKNSGFVSGFDVVIPGNVVETTIIVTDGVVKESPVSTENLYDKDTTYKYGDALNVAYKATVTYTWKDAEGKDVTVDKTVNNIMPTVKDSKLALNSFINNGKIVNVAGNFTLKYDIMGKTIEQEVKMAKDAYATKVNGNTDAVVYEGKKAEDIKAVDLYLNQTYEFGSSANYSFVVKGATNVPVENITPNGALVINSQDNMVIDGWKISFTKSGDYTVTGTILGATFEMSFKVGHAAPVKAAQFALNAVGFNAAGYMEINITRPSDLFAGNGLDVKFIAEMNGELIEGTKVYVLNGTEYTEINSIYLNSVINPLKPIKVFMKLPAEINERSVFTVTAIAVDEILYGKDAQAAEGTYNPYRLTPTGFNAGDGGNVKPFFGMRLISAVGKFDGVLEMEVSVNNTAFTKGTETSYDDMVDNSWYWIKEGNLDFMGLMQLPMSQVDASYDPNFATDAEYTAWGDRDPSSMMAWKLLPSGIAWKNMKAADKVEVKIYGTAKDTTDRVLLISYSN